MKKRVLWITETAVMLALLVAAQGVTAGLGNQLVTGSCVNLVLAVTALLVGPWGGAVVAVASPFLASAFGIGPKFVQLLPVIAVGNLCFVLVLSFTAGGNRPVWQRIIGCICGAGLKFAALFVLMVKLLVPMLVGNGTIPEKAAQVLTAQFSLPQLATALIGGTIALLIVPVLEKAIRRNGSKP